MNETNAIVNGTIVTPFKTIPKGKVVFKDGKIVAVGGKKDVEVPKDSKIIDASRKLVAPGFIDIHVHGGGGRDIMEASYEAINEVAKYLASHGTTAFLPTTVSTSQNDLLEVVKTVREVIEAGTRGAEVLGVNLEGPYISFEKRGAQNRDYLKLPSQNEFKEVFEASNRTVRIITLAPELDGARELMHMLRHLGITISIGHSNATYNEAVEAIKNGVTHATHTFNAMRGFHQREPGVVGAVLVHDRLTAELISDNFHVHPAAMKLLIKTKGTDKIVLVTDAIQASGMADGEYKLGGQNVFVKDGVCRLESGELAGSTLTMDKAIYNTAKSVHLPLRTTIGMATINPAVVIGVDKEKGSLEPGKDADIVIIDEEVNVHMTIVNGNVVYRI